MFSFRIVPLAVLAVAFANAIPFVSLEATEIVPDAIVKRVNPQPITCGSSPNERAWPLESVQDAYNALVTNGRKSGNNKPKAGTRAYPMQYGNPTPSDGSVVTALNAIAGCQTGQKGYKYFEFPITDPTFNGGPQGSQGPDRVIAISPPVGQGGTRQYAYCLAVTHRDESSPGAFDPCTASP